MYLSGLFLGVITTLSPAPCPQNKEHHRFKLMVYNYGCLTYS